MKNKNKITLAILTVALSSLLGACSTITRGTEEVLVVDSEPSNAQVCLSNGLSGTTPTSFKLKRKGNYTVRVEKEGYESACVQVNNEIGTEGAVGMAGNLVFGGLIGAGVDAISGASKDLKPNPVMVKLEPIPAKEKVES